MLKLAEDRPTFKTAANKSKTGTNIKPFYAFVPRDVLIRPPICSAKKAIKGRLTPFETALALAASSVARGQIDRDNKQRAFDEEGDRAIVLEKEYYKQFREDWRQVKAARRDGEHMPAPELVHTFKNKPTHRPMSLKAAVKKAGQHGYKQAVRRFKQSPPPDVVTVTLTRSAWLRYAGLSRNDSNRRALDEIALPVLAKPVLVGDHEKPPLLRGWKELPDGQLELQVDGEWLEVPFGLVPMPLPVQSAPALALLFWLRTIETHAA
jgi:hypothetical protein